MFKYLSKVMNNNRNARLSRRLLEQRKDQGWCNFACIHKVVSNFSALCSFAGASLFGAIFFGLDYRNTKLIYECAHYMGIAAVVLFFLAFLLSFFKEDAKQNNPVIATQTNFREPVQFGNNRIANISTNKLNLSNNLKLVESNSIVKQSAISENIKHTDTSSKILKFPSVNKQEEIVERALTINSSCKNLHADQTKQRETANTLLSNSSYKTHKHTGASKLREFTTTLSPTSSKNLHHTSTSKQEESASILPPNISSKALQKSSTSEQCDRAKVLSPNISSKLFQHVSMSEQKAKTLSAKPRLQSMGEKPSHIDRQLVLYEKPPKIPFYGQNFQSPLHQTRNLYEFMSPIASGYSPVTEITATKRMTIAPWGVTQEEYQIHQKTFYHDPRSPMGGISPQYGLRPTLNCDPNSGGVQEYQINQTTFYQHPPHLGGRISSNVSRPKLDNDQNGISSSMYNQPRQNKVSDVLTRLESMNIFH